MCLGEHTRDKLRCTDLNLGLIVDLDPRHSLKGVGSGRVDVGAVLIHVGM